MQLRRKASNVARTRHTFNAFTQTIFQQGKTLLSSLVVFLLALCLALLPGCALWGGGAGGTAGGVPGASAAASGAGEASGGSEASAGAAEHMLVSRVTNIPAALGELKKKGLWVYGTAADAPADLWQTKMTGPAALVIGSEGFGMGRLVSEQCDFTVSIPLLGKITSLNASAAAAILMYEVVRQRRDS